jgi:hypothetical protein
MATVVVIAYPDEDTAEQARATVWQLEEELIIQADQVAVISRDPEGEISRPYQPQRFLDSGRSDLGWVLGIAVWHAVLDPVCRLGDGRRLGSAVRSFPRQGRRPGFPAAGARCPAARHLGAVPGDRACDAGQGDRCATAVRRDRNPGGRFQTTTPRCSETRYSRLRSSMPRRQPDERSDRNREPRGIGGEALSRSLGCHYLSGPPGAELR